MGMDVYGKKHTAPEGEYFRSNVWHWRPIWDLVCHVAPDLIDAKLRQAGHFNDGAGLNAARARKLGDRLQALIESGEIRKACEEHAKRIAEIPEATCEICAGTGLRADPPSLGAGSYPCNGCGGDLAARKPGSGKRKPIETWYRLDHDAVAEFAAFCRASGGFSIR